MKKWIAAILVMALVSGCSKPASPSSGVKIGFNFELTGVVADYGNDEEKGASLAVKLANERGGLLGKTIEVVTLDNKSETAEAVSAMTKLATMEKVAGVVGPATSGITAASYSVANQHKVPLISPSATADGITLEKADDPSSVYEYAFRVCFLDSFQGTAMAIFAKEHLNAAKAVIIGDSSSDYAKGLAKNFNEHFTKNGGSITASEAYVEGDKDFSSVLTKIKDMDFDVIYIPGYYSEVGLIIKQARELGIDKAIIGGDGFDSPSLLDIAGAAALNRVYFTTAYTTVTEDPLVKDFVSAYKREYGKDPGMFNALGYDAAALLLDAIKRADSTDPVKVKDALLATKDFKGVTGSITFDELHNAIKSVLVVEVKDGVQTNSVEITVSK